jgi:UDP-N-acetylmuramoyl-tripeptide--D-alanyl-D-alanine ligase
MMLYLRVGRRRLRVRLNFLGAHNRVNALGAAAMAYGFGASLAAIRRGLQKAKPFPMRMQLENWKNIGIINDAYNANPASMKAAIKTLAGIECRGEKSAILGDMFELGRQTRREHLQLGKEVARAGIGRLYLLGARAKQVRQGALQGGRASGRHAGRAHRYWQRSCGSCPPVKESCAAGGLATFQGLTRDGNGADA